MLKTEEKLIDGYKFYVQQFPGKQGLLIWYRVARAIGPAALATAAFSANGSEDIGVLGGALQTLFNNCSPEELDSLVDAVLQGTSVKLPDTDTIVGLTSGAKVFDMVFVGRYMMLFSLLRFVLEVNYGDFIAALKKGIGPGATQ